MFDAEEKMVKPSVKAIKVSIPIDFTGAQQINFDRKSIIAEMKFDEFNFIKKTAEHDCIKLKIFSSETRWGTKTCTIS